MNVFVVMPFTSKHNCVYAAIKEACNKANVTVLRADEIRQPGPIINQIFDSITKADCIVAEVSDKNPNVFYEVGVAQAVGKPTILLAREETVNELPFDIQHNRVLLYDGENLNIIIEKLVEVLVYLEASIIGEEQPPTVETYLNNLSLSREDSRGVLSGLVNRISKEFSLTGAKLVEEKYLEKEGVVVTIEDDFEERVVVLVNINGIIRRKKKL